MMPLVLPDGCSSIFLAQMVLYTAQALRSWIQQYILGDTVKQELLHYCTVQA